MKAPSLRAQGFAQVQRVDRFEAEPDADPDERNIITATQFEVWQRHRLIAITTTEAEAETIAQQANRELQNTMPPAVGSPADLLRNMLAAEQAGDNRASHVKVLERRLEEMS